MLGLPGPAENVIFVLSRLMRCTDDVPDSDYNTGEYVHVSIRNKDLTREGTSILDFLDLPKTLKRYSKVWIGMDVGYVNDPSEILVFAEEPPSKSEIAFAKQERKALPEEGETRLKLITRVSLIYIREPEQVEVILHLIDFFRPIAFAMDRTGNGLPLYQRLTKELETAAVVNIEEKKLRASLTYLQRSGWPVVAAGRGHWYYAREAIIDLTTPTAPVGRRRQPERPATPVATSPSELVLQVVGSSTQGLLCQAAGAFYLVVPFTPQGVGGVADK